MNREETIYRISRKIDKKWEIINRDKYPNNGDFVIYVIECPPDPRVVAYKKNDILCLYYRTDKTKFMHNNFWKTFTVFKMAVEKVEEWVKENNYKGKIGFELCELEQFNVVTQKLAKRYGYDSYIENGFLIFVQKKWQKK